MRLFCRHDWTPGFDAEVGDPAVLVTSGPRFEAVLRICFRCGANRWEARELNPGRQGPPKPRPIYG